MVLQGLGPCLIVSLLRASREREPDSDWLLYGPADPEVVEAPAVEAPALLLAAE
ncbi:MAG TPA: hypothetical protein PLO65_09220 [Caulobacter sp.]|nr:hypothetical protein [Caulobacter sp.]